MLDTQCLTGLCDFLAISTPRSWLDDIARLIRLRDSYPIAEDRKAELRALAMRIIPDAPIARRVAEQIV